MLRATVWARRTWRVFSVAACCCATEPAKGAPASGLMYVIPVPRWAAAKRPRYPIGRFQCTLSMYGAAERVKPIKKPTAPAHGHRRLQSGNHIVRRTTAPTPNRYPLLVARVGDWRLRQEARRYDLGRHAVVHLRRVDRFGRRRRDHLQVQP